jgi:hypothetical protein
MLIYTILVIKGLQGGLKWTNGLCPQKGVDHVLDCIGDSLDAVASWFAHWLYDGWGHSYPACHRQRYSTDPRHSGNKDNKRRYSDLGPLTCSEKNSVFMKPIEFIGIALIIPGIVALAFQGITYTNRKKIIDIGPIQATQRPRRQWLSPILGWRYACRWNRAGHYWSPEIDPDDSRS